jgi:hypothetical protein
MSDREMWQQVYLAVIQAGHAEWVAKQAADSAVKNAPFGGAV